MELDPKRDRAVAAIRGFFMLRDYQERRMLNDIAKKELEEIAEKYAARRKERMDKVEAVNRQEREKENQMGTKMTAKRRAEMEADAAKQAAAQGGEAPETGGKLVKGTFGTGAEVKAKTAKAPAEPAAKGNPRFKVYGLYGVCPLLRYMGLMGWTKDEARTVLVGLGANPTENALSLDMAAGAKAKDDMTKYGPVAAVTVEDAVKLNALRGKVTPLAAIGEKPAETPAVEGHLEALKEIAKVEAKEAKRTRKAKAPAADEAPAGLAAMMTIPKAPYVYEADAAEAKRIAKNNKARERRAAKKA